MRADALRNRERILDVARAAFAEGGVDTSLEDIARQAGVGIGTLYRRFPTREDLIAAVLAERYLALADLALVLAEQDDVDAALTRWLRLLIEHMAIYRGLSLAVKEAIHDRTTALGQTCAEMIEAGERLLRRGQEAGVIIEGVTFFDVMTLASGIVTSVERRKEKPAHVDLPDLDPYMLLGIVLRGLRTRKD